MSPELETLIRLIASVFPGTMIWWNGAWRPIRVP